MNHTAAPLTIIIAPPSTEPLLHVDGRAAMLHSFRVDGRPVMLHSFRGVDAELQCCTASGGAKHSKPRAEALLVMVPRPLYE